MADPYANMVPGAFDALQVLLVKATYYAKAAAEAQGATGDDAMFANMSPQANDSLQVLAAKLAYWIQQIAGSGGSSGSAAVTTAAGAPPTDGSVTSMFYKDSSTGFKYINTGTIAVPTWEII